MTARSGGCRFWDRALARRAFERSFTAMSMLHFGLLHRTTFLTSAQSLESRTTSGFAETPPTDVPGSWNPASEKFADLGMLVNPGTAFRPNNCLHRRLTMLCVCHFRVGPTDELAARYKLQIGARER